MIGVEVCVNSVQSAIAAQDGGAVRVELCSNLLEGGTTPAMSQIEMAKENLDIELNVIIRPRGGDFLYDNLDFLSMTKDIDFCGKAGCDGVVIGILDAEGNVDINRNAKLIGIAKKYGMSVTFHRAFDRSADIYKSLEDIISLGCDRILTSGGHLSAYHGRFVIAELIKKSQNRIIIMPGSGIRVDNVEEIVRCTQAKEIHGTFQSRVEGGMIYHNPLFIDDTEYSYLLSNSGIISKIVKSLNP